MDAETDFDLLEVGIEGRLEAIPAQPKIRGLQLPFSTVPIGLPPVLPSTEDRLKEYLSHPEKLSVLDNTKAQRFIGREKNPRELYSIDVTPVQTQVVVERNQTTGELTGYKEDRIQGTGLSAKNSTSLHRPPGPPEKSVRGSSTNYPFWPGGLEEPNFDSLHSAGLTHEIDFENDLLEKAPELSRGVKFESKKLNTPSVSVGDTGVVSLVDILAATDHIDLGDDDEEVVQKGDKQAEETQKENVTGEPNIAPNVNIDEVIKLEHVVTESGDLVSGSAKEKKEEFAVYLDSSKPIEDFHRRIPDMAYKWPFELDAFQKQAVLQLESHQNVFVAAHTSAGKTVVAEYAIALSLKHMTRSIYTSPIKALSNQKFREFKETFKEVGLITGDVQINQEAACLIMTTEILRSMLYNGSDVIRDLEWVIFDEVHYINDSERGVVWEEVLIMLPQHVNIILLSATVPNTMEFADWIGRTKKRKVYVVSTQKRPVPLEHFLYTGNSAKTSNEMFMIVDAKKQFITGGYHKALDAKKERSSKQQQNFGAKGPRSGNPQQDKNVWLSVIEMLRKNDKLPVVAFTFSKKRIQDNANHLRSVDLTTAAEKSETHIFFQKCISRLKGTDRNLPQVKNMEDLLKRGIGIHHSGILPILKEVVEMLFGKGLVKILFATETFAMGVNMPARTVIFDSTRKHDGTNFRDLLPGEYIQMAGRAGRRGLDTTGTVIILCKGDVPEMADLHKMMLGKPTHLESRFRLTYSMILNLLRVEQLRVEDMMKRSFSEFHNQRDVVKHRTELNELTEKLSDLPEVIDYSGDLEEYYNNCDDYWKLKKELQAVTMSHPQTIKSLSAGRVIIVNNKTHKNVLGVVLKTGPASNKDRTFTALVICEQKRPEDNFNRRPPENNTQNRSENSLNSEDGEYPQPVIDCELFHPEGACGHCLEELKGDSISVVTVKTLKVNADKIIDDIRKRQMPRFRNDPPGQSVSLTTQELLRLVEANPKGLPGLDAQKDLHIRDIDLVERFRRLTLLEESFPKYSCIHDPTFTENFKQLRSNMKLKKKHSDLQFKLSDASLQLLPEYEQRVNVLRSLFYVDKTNTVQLKGRVACEISNHELIITELVFENALTSLKPAEMAAILSCVVFEQKKSDDQNLTKELEQAKEEFLKVATKIGELQKQCGLTEPVEDYVEKFNFGLVEVVYEWALGKPFSEIIKLTLVEEGIIVRCIQRLDEVLKDVRNAARIIGDPVLCQKMEEASRMIKRDIVFAASLYTS